MSAGYQLHLGPRRRTSSLETQAHHLLGPGLEMALWGVGYIPWYWGTQFPLSANSPDEPFQGLETEAGRQAGRQFPEAMEHLAHSPRFLG